MKRPKHMNMRELIALPELRERDKLKAGCDVPYGGAFRDENGYVWGTLKLASGWVRYPTHLCL